MGEWQIRIANKWRWTCCCGWSKAWHNATKHSIFLVFVFGGRTCSTLCPLFALVLRNSHRKEQRWNHQECCECLHVLSSLGIVLWSKQIPFLGNIACCCENPAIRSWCECRIRSDSCRKTILEEGLIIREARGTVLVFWTFSHKVELRLNWSLADWSHNCACLGLTPIKFYACAQNLWKSGRKSSVFIRGPAPFFSPLNWRPLHKNLT